MKIQKGIRIRSFIQAYLLTMRWFLVFVVVVLFLFNIDGEYYSPLFHQLIFDDVLFVLYFIVTNLVIFLAIAFPFFMFFKSMSYLGRLFNTILLGAMVGLFNKFGFPIALDNDYISYFLAAGVVFGLVLFYYYQKQIELKPSSPIDPSIFS